MKFLISSLCMVFSSAEPPLFPRVFVYDLPEKDGDIMLRDERCHGKDPAIEDGISCLFGFRFEVKVDDVKLTMRMTDQFALARIIHARLQNSKHITRNPEEADLFYVPIWRDTFIENRTTCPTGNQVKALLVHLNLATADRHFFISPRVGDSRWGDMCDFMVDDKDALLSKTMKMALEDKLCCEEDWRLPYSIPYPSFGSGLSESEHEKLVLVASNMTRQRQNLAMFAGRSHGLDVGLRDKWAKACDDANDCDRVDMKSVGLIFDNEEIGRNIISSMLNAKFCLMPVGDTPSRKGIVDAIMLGCVPVFNDARQAFLWPWHIDNFWAAAVVVPHVYQDDVIGYLRGLPEAQVRQHQRAVTIAAQRLPYMLSERSGSLRPFDAVEAMLDGAQSRTWKYFQNSEVQFPPPPPAPAAQFPPPPPAPAALVMHVALVTVSLFLLVSLIFNVYVCLRSTQHKASTIVVETELRRAPAFSISDAFLQQHP